VLSGVNVQAGFGFSLLEEEQMKFCSCSKPLFFHFSLLTKRPSLVATNPWHVARELIGFNENYTRKPAQMQVEISESRIFCQVRIFGFP
jgi:hypothetical protein